MIVDIINSFCNSPKHVNIVKRVAEALCCSQTHIQPLYPTCFTVKYQAFDGLSKQLPAIISVLTEIEEQSDNKDICFQAAGFQEQMGKFHFFFCLTISLHLFKITDHLSIQIQLPGVNVAQGIELTKYSLTELTKQRSDMAFSELWQTALSLANENQADPPALPRRQPSAPKRFQATAAHQFTSPEEFYRVQYYEMLDRAISCLQERICTQELLVLSAIESVLKAAWESQPLNHQHINMITEYFGDDLDRARLVPLLQTLENLCASVSVTGR